MTGAAVAERRVAGSGAEGSRAGLRRSAGLLAFLTAALSALLVTSGPGTANAFDVGTLGRTVYLPAGLTAGVTGSGTVGAVLGTGLIAPLDVALGGFAIGFAAGTAGTQAVTWAWRWASQSSDGKNTAAGYADAAPSVLLGSAPGAGTWTALVSYCSGPQGDTITCNTGFGPSTVTARVSEGVKAGSTSGKIWNYVGDTDKFYPFLNVLCDGASSFVISPNAAGDVSQCAAFGGLRDAPLVLSNSGRGTDFASIRLQPATSSGAAPAAGSGASGTRVLSTRAHACFASGACVDGAPVTYTGGTLARDLPPITVPASPDGSPRTSVTWPSTGGTDPVPAPLPTWTAPVVPSSFPQCQPLGTCVLTVTRHALDGALANCSASTLCSGWASMPRTGPQQALLVLTATGSQAVGSTVTEAQPMAPDGSWFECHWGPYALRAVECGTVPTEAPGVAPPGVAASNCDGSGLSFSPITWVIEPLKCLFMPAPTTMQAAWGQARGGFNATGIPAWGSALGGVGGALAVIGGPGTEGCAGPHFTLTLKGHDYAFDPLNACSQPMRGVALVIRLFASLSVIVGGARLCARPVLTAIGMRGAV